MLSFSLLPLTPSWYVLFSVSFSISSSHSLSVCLSLSCPASTLLWKQAAAAPSSSQFFFSLSLSILRKKKIPCPPPLLLSFHTLLLRPVLFSLPCCQGEATYLRVLHIYWFMKLVVSMILKRCSSWATVYQEYTVFYKKRPCVYYVYALFMLNKACIKSACS